MNRVLKRILPVILLGFAISGCTGRLSEYPLAAIGPAEVEITDSFWSEIIDRNLDVTLPYVLNEMSTRNSMGGSGLSKVIEGISWYLMINDDPQLEELADSLVAIISATQHSDGYIGRRRTADDGSALPDSLFWFGTDDFGERGGSPMLYSFGHLYEAAVAYYQATGKRSLLDVAEKNAQLLLTVFGPGKLESYPFHPELELALVKLYRATGNEDYLALSKFFLDSRGPNGTEYSQSHQKIVDQQEATGHAVRALYLYSGIADIVALTGDKGYERALNAIWRSVTESKTYITGGFGAYADHEAFGEPYILPNETAYNETCASIAAVLWSHRMFMLYGDASYIDVLERTLYNSLLSGISISGDRFFYPNPLASSAQYQRASWYGVACCPTNIVRFMPQVPGLIYASRENDLFVNLFIGSSTEVALDGGIVSVTQETAYPWEGDIELIVDPATSFEFTLRIRIPGWATGKPLPSSLYQFTESSGKEVKLLINGRDETVKSVDGYAVIKRTWSAGDRVRLELPMDVRKITADMRVEEDRGSLALQRGPLVYCLEGPDNQNMQVRNILVSRDAPVTIAEDRDDYDRYHQLEMKGSGYRVDSAGNISVMGEQLVTAIPYFLWANRGPAEMVVWIPEDKEAVIPAAEPSHTIAYKSHVVASYDTSTLKGINDQFIIPYNQNVPISSYYRWPMGDTVQWVEYRFEKELTVSSTEVYWYDNEPSRMTTWYNGIPWTCCRVPESWELYWLDKNGSWQPVQPDGEYGTGKYMFNRVDFTPVTTSSLRMVVKRNEVCASGIIEWIVN